MLVYLGRGCVRIRIICQRLKGIDNSRPNPNECVHNAR